MSMEIEVVLKKKMTHESIMKNMKAYKSRGWEVWVYKKDFFQDTALVELEKPE